MNSTGTLVDLPLLRDYRRNIHSQNGEDGVLLELLGRLGRLDGDDLWCVEFGAWDGKHLSNTFALVERGWKAVYIEGDPIKYADLQRTASEHPSITALRAMVASDDRAYNSLRRLLAATAVPTEFDVLSVDIDSFDLEVWENFSSYRPKVVVIEIDSAFPPGVIWRHTQSHPHRVNSFTATQRVATSKGYTLVCHTANGIYVANELIDRVRLPSRYRELPELLFDYSYIQETRAGTGSLVRRLARKALPVRVRSALKKI